MPNLRMNNKLKHRNNKFNKSVNNLSNKDKNNSNNMKIISISKENIIVNQIIMSRNLVHWKCSSIYSR